LLITALVACACSSGPNAPGAQGDGSRLGGDHGKKGDDGKRGGGRGNDGSSGATNNNVPGGDEPSSSGQVVQPMPQSSSGFVSNGPPSPIDPTLARKSASVQDGPNDGESAGVVPPYSEVISASIEGLGDDVRLTMTFNGAVPERMDDERTYMVIGWATSMGGDQNYAISARCSTDGWTTFAGRKNDTSELPGTFEVNGNSLVAQVPWSFFDGPRAFKWYASSSWFKSLAGTTHYLFDTVPNEKAGSFPG
jgi:hypothetical protein